VQCADSYKFGIFNSFELSEAITLLPGAVIASKVIKPKEIITMAQRKANLSDPLVKQHLAAGLDPEDIQYLLPDLKVVQRTQPTYIGHICIG
jgi:hypothetical protein